MQLTFKDFDDYWTSQTAASNLDMSDAVVARLKGLLRERLPTNENGQISYMARANAVRGRVPD